jgi:thioredoxin reductase (NADPH)
VTDLVDANARVTMAVRGDDLGTSMSRYLVDRIEQHANVDVRLNTGVTRVEGDENGELGRAALRAGGDREETRDGAVRLHRRHARTGWADDVGVAHRRLAELRDGR